ncbi:secreted RxLR effector protein 78-like [Rutidosis leptorrhynchoides]|uniref:secreted RxLR effector protein 78-like n=1 Tax=Rutidosis leptorrhynchoides TaxID=125765 RepID=UPI003A992B25
MDSILSANEIIDDLKARKCKSLIFKADFVKAFDSINWNYLSTVLKLMGFGPKWCTWIRSCRDSAKVSVLVNGSSTKEFLLHRGVRQGDPLSPYFFILASEGLNRLIKNAINVDLFNGVHIGSDRITVSHLQYVDDTIILG